MPKYSDILENKTDIVHCEGNKLEGGEDLAEMFLPLVLECQLKVGSMELNVSQQSSLTLLFLKFQDPK